MDTSELSQAGSRPDALPPLVRKLWLASGLPPAAIRITVMAVAVFSLGSAGCNSIKQTTANETTGASSSRTNSVAPPASLDQSPEKSYGPRRVPAPAPVPPLRPSETKPALVISRTAEKPTAPNPPAPARASELMSIPATKPAVATPAPIIGESRTVSSGIGQELISKGPPHPPRPRKAGIAWVGVALGGVTLGVGAWYAAQRRRKSFHVTPADEDEINLPRDR